MSINTRDLQKRLKVNRQIEGISAVLLPYADAQSIDTDGFIQITQRTLAAGITPAVNMDTGYANLISDEERRLVLEMTQSIADGRPFVAGAYVQGKAGDPMEHYRKQVEEIQHYGGTPIIFPSDYLGSLEDAQIVGFYREIAKLCPRFIGFELGQMFVPFGRIFSSEVFRDILEIPQLVGIKHSSLNRDLEWERLQIRDETRPDFKVYTGNDLAIDLVYWGSDYLLGLSAFYPEAFALRDKLWAEGDARAMSLNDLLQYLGFFSFRDSVPAYKHTAAQFLHLRGLIKTSLTHQGSPTRPDSDVAILANILERLDAMVEEYSACVVS